MKFQFYPSLPIRFLWNENIFHKTITTAKNKIGSIGIENLVSVFITNACPIDVN